MNLLVIKSYKITENIFTVVELPVYLVFFLSDVLGD